MRQMTRTIVLTTVLTTVPSIVPMILPIIVPSLPLFAGGTAYAQAADENFQVRVEEAQSLFAGGTAYAQATDENFQVRVEEAQSLFAGGIAHAQAADEDLQMRVEEAQSLVRENLRELLREELMLTDEESRRFWPVYGGYEEERIAIADRYTSILTEFVTRYRQGTLGDRDADRLLDGYLDVKNDTIRLRKRYVGKFRRVLPGVKVTRFYQLENKIQADVDAVLARTVPLADPR